MNSQSQRLPLSSMNYYTQENNHSNPFPLSSQKQQQFDNGQKQLNFSTYNTNQIQGNSGAKILNTSHQKQGKTSLMFSSQKIGKQFQSFQSEQKRKLPQFGKRPFDTSQVQSIKKQERMQYGQQSQNSQYKDLTPIKSQSQNTVDSLLKEQTNKKSIQSLKKERLFLQDDQETQIDFSKQSYIPDIDDTLVKKMEETLVNAFPGRQNFPVEFEFQLENIKEEEYQSEVSQILMDNVFKDFQFEFENDMFGQEKENEQQEYFDNEYCINTQKLNDFLVCTKKNSNIFQMNQNSNKKYNNDNFERTDKRCQKMVLEKEDKQDSYKFMDVIDDENENGFEDDGQEEKDISEIRFDELFQF